MNGSEADIVKLLVKLTSGDELITKLEGHKEAVTSQHGTLLSIHCNNRTNLLLSQ